MHLYNMLLYDTNSELSCYMTKKDNHFCYCTQHFCMKVHCWLCIVILHSDWIREHQPRFHTVQNKVILHGLGVDWFLISITGSYMVLKVMKKRYPHIQLIKRWSVSFIGTLTKEIGHVIRQLYCVGPKETMYYLYF